MPVALNQVEIYFSIIQRKVLTPNDFASLEEVEQRLRLYEELSNRTPRLFQWKFDGVSTNVPGKTESQTRTRVFGVGPLTTQSPHKALSLTPALIVNRTTKPPASPGIGPDETITVTIKGAGNTETVQRLNQAIIAIMKPLSSNWRVSYGTSGDKTIFRVGPVTDPRAIADKIDFGKVTSVEGRTIDVEAAP